MPPKTHFTFLQKTLLLALLPVVLPLKFGAILLAVGIGIRNGSIIDPALLAVPMLLLGYREKVKSAGSVSERFVDMLRMFTLTKFTERSLKEYLTDLRVRVGPRGLKAAFTRAPVYFPETRSLVDLWALPTARIFTHRSTLSAPGSESSTTAVRLPSTYFAIHSAHTSSIIVTAVSPEQLTPMRRFLLFHEIGHCTDAHGARDRTIFYIHQSARLFLLLSIGLAISCQEWLTPAAVAGLTALTAWWIRPTTALEREKLADLFAVANISGEDARSLCARLKVRADLFWDRTLSDAENNDRLARLRELLELRMVEEEKFWAYCDHDMWGLAHPTLLTFKIFVLGAAAWVPLYTVISAGLLPSRWFLIGITIVIHLFTLIDFFFLSGDDLWISRKAALLSPMPMCLPRGSPKGRTEGARKSKGTARESTIAKGSGEDRSLRRSKDRT